MPLTRKPRIAIMGEFSSGKSTLSNILLGGQILPTQVTATRLPPVFVSYGQPGAHAITREGVRVAVDLSDLSAMTPDAFRSLHVTMIADMLELCDLLDMPGISDPNMPIDTWDAIVESTDHVIWCTHATQAWRQSEAAMWDRMRASTAGRDLLLITQFDKLHNPRDRARVQSRVAAETQGKFTAVYPVALLDARAAGDDFDLWQASGVHAVTEHLIDLLMSFESPAPMPAPGATAFVSTAVQADAAPEVRLASGANNVIEIPRGRLSASSADASAEVQPKGPVRPRRVRPKESHSRPPRPARDKGWPEMLKPGNL